MPQDFKLASRKWKLRLKFSASELRQGDLEKFMGEVERSLLGGSAVEHSGKVIRAAIVCGWVEEPAGLTAEQVEQMEPAKARWMAMQIDALYIAALTVPKV